MTTCTMRGMKVSSKQPEMNSGRRLVQHALLYTYTETKERMMRVYVVLEEDRGCGPSVAGVPLYNCVIYRYYKNYVKPTRK